MNEMKAKALEKLMMILDEVLGEDVVGRLKEKVGEKTGMESEDEGPKHETAEGPEAEKVEDVLEGAMGEETPGEHGKPKGKGAPGVGMEVSKVEVAAMPKPGLMKKMRGLK